jgi:hypothetical protein
MHGAICTAALAAALLISSFYARDATAQFGHLNYPQSDFKWVWGRQNELRRNGFADFDVSGRDAGFDCTLQGRLHPGSRLTQTDIRGLENDLSQSLYFIETAANTMYVLDQQRDIDWAELDCVKPVIDESAAELAEREAKARAKAERDRERRRERRARDEARD